MGKGGDSQVCRARDRGKGARAMPAPPVTEARLLPTGPVTELGPREERDLPWCPSQLAATQKKPLSAQILKGKEAPWGQQQ